MLVILQLDAGECASSFKARRVGIVEAWEELYVTEQVSSILRAVVNGVEADVRCRRGGSSPGRSSIQSLSAPAPSHTEESPNWIPARRCHGSDNGATHMEVSKLC